MSEQSITVAQEVEAILAVQAANYQNSASVLDGDVATFYLDVAAELRWILDDARKRADAASEEVAPESKVPFPVGSKVLLTGDGWYGPSTPHVGDVVEIVRINSGDSMFETADDAEWYVSGDEDDYWGGKLVDDTIRVGDTVRILPLYKETGMAYGGDSNQPGVEFVVTETHAAELRHVHGPDSGLVSNFYVMGDPAGRGIWEQFIEKVYA